MQVTPPLVLFKNRHYGRPTTFDEYRAGGGYEALFATIGKRTPAEVTQIVLDADLRGRGGAGFPAGRKWQGIPAGYVGPRYVVVNTDEMEPGTFKDRVLVNVDPHLVIEGIILCAYAVSATLGICFIRPSYEADARLLERETQVARNNGLLGKNILGSDFSFDIHIHRSAGRYICGEASAQIKAISGLRPNPRKGGPRTSVKGLWDCPTIVNNLETLANLPGIVANGPAWFKGLAHSETGSGTKLFSVSGRVVRPDCYELPIGTPLREIIFDHAGGMPPGRVIKAVIPGGASSPFMPEKYLDLQMDFEPMRKAGQRLGTASIIVFDQNTCLVGATLNLMEFFARESCGWCTPCREGLPYVRDLLRLIEGGEGREEHIDMIKDMGKAMLSAYCAFAPGAAEPLLSLFTHFEAEVREHLRQKRCPFGNPPPALRGKACGTRPANFGPTLCPEDQCPI
ncbi:NADH dehydrogenase (quinone) [Solidesulfovibrio carbinoliphilus subsp. oakridgensis]|uniref:NADH dehydrogenase (Quinone) n=1 Tax=Solidesulfovibrio carbinoliphilus subsp. oakridgensis TaxID=694327 RepID=G7QCY3_9BACT|nr:NADH-quinone oxidoreductase subunit F [Solidesulfovibrio carbinoliphilus]EHJ46289.1 NADH dehydrogenase (quinone) [Solidesulfovibrio carbinoliphilus subsp. oakridgensis]